MYVPVARWKQNKLVDVNACVCVYVCTITLRHIHMPIVVRLYTVVRLHFYTSTLACVDAPICFGAFECHRRHPEWGAWDTDRQLEWMAIERFTGRKTQCLSWLHLSIHPLHRMSLYIQTGYEIQGNEIASILIPWSNVTQILQGNRMIPY